MTLAPSGRLRAGMMAAPVAGSLFVAIGPDEVPRGGVMPVFEALARHMGLPLEPVVFANSGACTDALEAGSIDVAFMPVDADRAARVSFGPALLAVESTFLVSAASGLRTLAEVDRPGVRVVGIAGTTTIRAATRFLTHTAPVAAEGVAEAFAMFREGRADAVALSRDVLDVEARAYPGSRVVEGGFQQTTVSIAVPPNRPEVLAAVTGWMEARAS